MIIREDKSNNNRKIRSGLIWSFGERILAQFVSTLVTIVLARLLDPAHYGIISLVTVFITVCNVFVSSGFGSAIVQKKEIDDVDYNTAFFLSLSMSIILYFILFFISPMIAGFYQMPELVPVVRVMALRLPVAAINTIQQAHVRREMAFKRFFIATLLGTLLSGGVGICMALTGFGVWALVAQYLTNTTVDTIVLFFAEKWFPKLQFSMQKAKEIFSFGWKVLATDLIFTLEADIRSLIIGKVFGSADLAYFEQGKKYPAILVNNINSSINKVMLPAFARKQDDIEQLKKLLRRAVRIGIFIMAPILIGFAAVAPTFVPLVLTENWNTCIPFIQLFCLSYLTRPLETSCHQALLGLGKSGTVLKIMIAIHSVDLILVVIAVFIFHSVMLIAIGSLLATIISLCCFLSQSKRIIGYQFKEQVSDICPVLAISAVMGAAVIMVGYMIDNLWIKMLVEVFVGGTIYVILSGIFKPEGYHYCVKLLSKMMNKVRRNVSRG